jgi:hypothetical protein
MCKYIYHLSAGGKYNKIAESVRLLRRFPKAGAAAKKPLRQVVRKNNFTFGDFNKKIGAYPFRHTRYN